MFGRISSPVFAGRGSELAALSRALDSARQGTPALVLMGGEAGCGKSRLVREFVSRVTCDAAPLLVLTGECPDVAGSGLPYAPFAGVMRDLIWQRGMAEVTDLLPDEASADLATLLPEFGFPARTDEFGFWRSRLFGVLLTLLEQLAAQQPTVLIVEDLHWADGPSRDLLAFLAQNLRHSPALMIATFRSDELHGTHPLRRLLLEVGRLPTTTRLELERLTRAEAAVQMAGILGRAPAPLLVDAVYERSDGNPLFTEAGLNPDGSVAAGVPRSLEDMLAYRLTQLPSETQRVLQTVAVFGGTRIGHVLLAKCTGLDDRQLSDALRPAVDSNVIVVDEDEYTFRHALLRSAAQQQLFAGERAQLHRSFAEVLEAEPSLASQPLPSVQVALHWRAAQEYGRALRAAWQAAADAGAAHAYSIQLQMLEETLQLWHRAPLATRPPGIDRGAVIDRAVEAARLAGEPRRGLAVLEAAGSEWDDRDPERAALLLRSRAALRQQLLLPGQVDDLRSALRLAEGPTRSRALALGLLIRALGVLDHDDEADALRREMLDLAARLEDDALVLEASIRLAAVEARRGDHGITQLQRCVENAQRLGLAELELLARVAMTYALEGRGDHEAAVAAGRADLARVQQLGLNRYVTAPIAQSLVESLTSMGAWDEALEMIEATLRLDPAPYGRAFLLVERSQIDLARGDLESVQRGLEELDSLLPTDEVFSELALPVSNRRMQLLLAEGDVEAALASARAFADEPSGTDPRYVWPALATAMRVCADAAGGRSRPSRNAASVRHAIAERAAHLAQPSRVAQVYAALLAAEAARADGRPDLAGWDRAAEGWKAIGQPYALGYALLHGSEAAAANGDRDAAAVRVVRSVEVASQLGARPLLDQAVRHARRARLQLPTDLVPSSAESRTPLGLTSREAEVLRLVASGHGNKQIAAELFISPKTASVHVSRILTKLGVASRTEAAAVAHRMGLVDAN